MSKKAKNSFESNIKRLEVISQLLDSDDIPLEEAILLYEEGIILSKECMQALNSAELKITELQKSLKKSIAEPSILLEEKQQEL
jgi:exodeoxyribonuclease VII small subunit